MSTNLTPLKIKELLGNNNYSIPIYQRNYAWGEKEITQLIQDIVDYSVEKPDTNYYLGTLVVYEKKNANDDTVFETIDGQQRLTTLTILLSALKNNQTILDFSNDISWFTLNLAFDSRIKSTETLKDVFTNEIKHKNHFNAEIKQAYEDCLKITQRILKENNQNFTDFCSYLFEKVMILRVPVPKDTDLNHYFEIMNSRGEQLEKHEVLKAKCLEFVANKESETYAFNLIWEACANMEKYVQYGFKVEERDLVFGKNDWNKLAVGSFDELSDLLAKNPKAFNQNDNNYTIVNILQNKKLTTNPSVTDSENPDRFNSVINFSNFLLHVLRIQEKEDIALDDKRLISIFEKVIDDKKKDGKDLEEFVKTFAFNLLKTKFLFDKYIIKREFLNGKDNWSLKRLKWYKDNKISYVNSISIDDINENEGENRTVLMLLSMFHVSTPTLVYKHWLNAALNYVFENDNLTTSNYITYLENLAKAFLFDRYIANEQSDYFNIIYQNLGIPENTIFDLNKLDKGTSVENFIFNYLDYLLWKQDRTKYDSFKFSFRSSVEHYYPQHPLEGLTVLDQSDVDKFGNLCLISSTTNSRLWNLPPEAKRTYFLETNTHESIKQKIMMEYEDWTLKEIEDHREKMLKVLLD
jgi:uncharacterized protein with ParB-like and HNH nuclease domain